MVLAAMWQFSFQLHFYFCLLTAVQLCLVGAVKAILFQCGGLVEQLWC